ncbi:inositol monophosphatase 3-like isoform X2 [Xenopus laevis]|uniref:Inositol monophosphatase 3 n=1 Tax=Xenopus laevis TaxID=8355 RepID=A0A8J0VL85_XENLA|nr:inositol monophosphatase 3-like isoform X2 [Xenopus laevis]
MRNKGPSTYISHSANPTPIAVPHRHFPSSQPRLTRMYCAPPGTATPRPVGKERCPSAHNQEEPTTYSPWGDSTREVNTEEKVDANEEDSISWDRDIPDDIKDKIKTSKHVASESITIWIDPLDATHEYTENLVNYVTTMVCVAVNGKPVIGVVHKPFTGYTAWAMVDEGANIKKRNSYNEKTPTFIVSRSHSGQVKEVTRQTFGNKTEILSAGGAGYKVLSLLDVSANEQETADVYIHVTYIKKWDICAGNAILNALGGHMTTLKGEEISYTGSEQNEGGLLASIGMDHSALVDKLAKKISVNAKKPAK